MAKFPLALVLAATVTVAYGQSTAQPSAENTATLREMFNVPACTGGKVNSVLEASRVACGLGD